MDAIASPRLTPPPLLREIGGRSFKVPIISGRRIQSVLYVDDDPDICEVVQATLGFMAGLNVYAAGSGEQAIALAYAREPDLILMDVMMPGLDGPSTLTRMRASARLANIPVIFLTAKVLPAEVAQLLQLGALGVIGKPFDPLTLCDELYALWNTACSVPTIDRSESIRAQVQTEVDSLTRCFLERTRDDVIRIRDMIERARREASALKDIERLTHSIHGAGAMYGFPGISALGGAMERLVAQSMACTTAPGLTGEGAILERLAEFTNRLEHATQAADQTP